MRPHVPDEEQAAADGSSTPGNRRAAPRHQACNHDRSQGHEDTLRSPLIQGKKKGRCASSSSPRLEGCESTSLGKGKEMGVLAPAKAVLVVTLVACFLSSASAVALDRQGILRLRGGGLRGQSGGGVAGGGRRDAKGASSGGWWRRKQAVVQDESITVQKVTLNHHKLVDFRHFSTTSPPLFRACRQDAAGACISMRLRAGSVCIRGSVTDRLYCGRSWPYLALFSR
jgi:hypothetical protein